MKFSIVVPVYNTKKYLAKCIKSIIHQTFNDFELILIDDGSTDGSQEICDEYAVYDSRVKVIHTLNSGAAAARNRGIERAQGEYICFLDSDDYWDTNRALEKINAAVTENTDILQMSLKVLHKDGQVETRNCDYSSYRDLSNEEKIVKLVDEERFMVSACGMVIRRGFLKDNGYTFVEGIRAEDVEWAIRMFSSCPNVEFLEESIYVIRTGREGSVTSTVNYKHVCDYCEVIERSFNSARACAGVLGKSLSDYIAYHILIAAALSECVSLSNKEKKHIELRLRAVSKLVLRKVKFGIKARIGSLIYRFTGFKVMAKIMSFYLNYRR